MVAQLGWDADQSNQPSAIGDFMGVNPRIGSMPDMPAPPQIQDIPPSMLGQGLPMSAVDAMRPQLSRAADIPDPAMADFRYAQQGARAPIGYGPNGAPVQLGALSPDVQQMAVDNYARSVAPPTQPGGTRNFLRKVGNLMVQLSPIPAEIAAARNPLMWGAAQQAQQNAQRIQQGWGQHQQDAASARMAYQKQAYDQMMQGSPYSMPNQLSIMKQQGDMSAQQYRQDMENKQFDQNTLHQNRGDALAQSSQDWTRQHQGAEDTRADKRLGFDMQQGTQSNSLDMAKLNATIAQNMRMANIEQAKINQAAQAGLIPAQEAQNRSLMLHQQINQQNAQAQAAVQQNLQKSRMDADEIVVDKTGSPVMQDGQYVYKRPEMHQQYFPQQATAQAPASNPLGDFFNGVRNWVAGPPAAADGQSAGAKNGGSGGAKPLTQNVVNQMIQQYGNNPARIKSELQAMGFDVN